MAWIEYHTELRDHWKIQKLSEILGCEYATALGYVSCLWLWVAQYSPNGSLKTFSDSQIKHAARTTNDKFSKKNIFACGLIDAKDKINDWNKHGLKLLESRRKRQREYKKRLRRPSVESTQSLPLPNQPNLTIPNLKIKDQPQASGLSEKPKEISPYLVDLKTVSICGLDEPAKHKIYNETIRIFRVRGWDLKDLPLRAFKTVSEAVNKTQPKDIYPYFKVAMEKHCRENSELYSQQSKIIQKKSSPVAQSVADVMAGMVKVTAA